MSYNVNMMIPELILSLNLVIIGLHNVLSAIQEHQVIIITMPVGLLLTWINFNPIMDK